MGALKKDWQVVGPQFKRLFSYRATALRAAIQMASLQRGTIFAVNRFDYETGTWVPFTRAWVHA